MSDSFLRVASKPSTFALPNGDDSLEFEEVFLINAVAFRTMYPPEATIGSAVEINDRHYIILWSAVCEPESKEHFVGLVSNTEGVKEKVLQAKQVIDLDPHERDKQAAFAKNAAYCSSHFPPTITPEEVPDFVSPWEK